ncbi:MAG: prepilin-type N-terminal cleavage/methylation domain-containing protein [Planctomycetota bacterium]
MNTRGFTLIEILVTVAVLTVVAVAVGGMLITSQNTFSMGTTLGTLQDQSRFVVDKIANELQQSGTSTFAPASPSGVTSLAFQKCTGYVASARTWGNAITYAFAYETGEVNDGADNNGNGLADEGIITRTEGTQTVTVARYVREGSFMFTLSGKVLKVEVVLERKDAKGRLLSASASTSIQTKN